MITNTILTTLLSVLLNHRNNNCIPFLNIIFYSLSIKHAITLYKAVYLSNIILFIIMHLRKNNQNKRLQTKLFFMYFCLLSVFIFKYKIVIRIKQKEKNAICL